MLGRSRYPSRNDPIQRSVDSVKEVSRITAWCRRRMHLALLVLILCPVGGLAGEGKGEPK